MSDTKDYEGLLKSTFGYQKKQQAKTDPLGGGQPNGFTPDLSAQKKEYETRNSVNRDQFSPDIMGAVQANVWKDGNPPPPKAPTAKMAEQGTGPAMAGSEKGWGKL